MSDRAILTLISDYLQKMGMDYTYSIFVSEANLDNICLNNQDLERMFTTKKLAKILSASKSPMLLKRIFEFLFGQSETDKKNIHC